MESSASESRSTIQSLMQALSVITFGDFDEFSRIRKFENTTIPEMSKVNITQLLLEVYVTQLLIATCSIPNLYNAKKCMWLIDSIHKLRNASARESGNWQI